MAVVLDTNYKAPEVLGWCSDLSTNSSSDGGLSVPLNGFTRYIIWASECQTFQIQWRYRSRYVKSAAILLDNSGADVWTAWSAWAGDTQDTDWHAAVIKVDNRRALSTPFNFAYDMTTYDKIQYEIRVRTYNSDLHVSEWGSRITNVDFCPQVTTAAAEPIGNNQYTINVDTNSERPLSSAKYRIAGDFGYEREFDPSTDGDVSVTVNATKKSLELNPGYIAFNIFKIIGEGTSYAEYDVNSGVVTYMRNTCIPITSHTPQTVPTYTTAITKSQELTTLKVTTASAVTSVAMSVSWTDIRGVEFFELLEVTDDGTGKVWTGYLEYPPLDTEITWHFSITYNGDWKDDTKKFTVDSDGLCLLDGEDEHFQIRYNPQVDFNYENEHELISIAGKKNPVARYGEHTKREVSLKGVILNPSFDSTYGDMWLRDAEVLDSSHVWLLRLPGGYRQRVTIESSDLAGDKGSSGKWFEVSLNMAEVE